MQSANVALLTLRSPPTWPFTLSEVLQPVCFSVIHNVSNASAKCENMQWVSILKTVTLDSELFEVRLLFLELFEAVLFFYFCLFLCVLQIRVLSVKLCKEFSTPQLCSPPLLKTKSIGPREGTSASSFISPCRSASSTSLAGQLGIFRVVRS